MSFVPKGELLRSPKGTKRQYMPKGPSLSLVLSVPKGERSPFGPFGPLRLVGFASR